MEFSRSLRPGIQKSALVFTRVGLSTETLEGQPLLMAGKAVGGQSLAVGPIVIPKPWGRWLSLPKCMFAEEARNTRCVAMNIKSLRRSLLREIRGWGQALMARPKPGPLPYSLPVWKGR